MDKEQLRFHRAGHIMNCVLPSSLATVEKVEESNAAGLCQSTVLDSIRALALRGLLCCASCVTNIVPTVGIVFETQNAQHRPQSIRFGTTHDITMPQQ